MESVLGIGVYRYIVLCIYSVDYVAYTLEKASVMFRTLCGTHSYCKTTRSSDIFVYVVSLIFYLLAC